MKPKRLSKKILKDIWDQVPPDYYDLGIKNNLFQKIWHTHKLDQVLKLLPKNSKNILDVGCASGILTAEIAKTFPEGKITGVDCYNKAIAFAQKKYPHINFKVADAHRLPIKDKSFDLVICTETLEHLVDPKKALLEIRRVLKKGGQSIISMDSGNLMFHIIWHFWTKTHGRVWQNAHLHEFNTKVLEDLILESGFRIKKKNYSHLGMAVTFLVSPK